MAETEKREVIVERDRRGPGVGVAVAIILLILIILFLLFGGLKMFSGGTTNTTNIQAPAPSVSTGGGTGQ